MTINTGGANLIEFPTERIKLTRHNSILHPKVFSADIQINEDTFTF